MSSNVSVIEKNLSKPTFLFGIRLWVLLAAAALLLLVTLIIISLYLLFRLHLRKPYRKSPTFCLPLSHIAPNKCQNLQRGDSSLDRQLLPRDFSRVLSGQWPAPASGAIAKANVFTLTEIREITGGFNDENVIGRGECGIVYRGFFLGSPVAVKKLLQLLPAQSHETEDFVTRVEKISHVSHKNVVKLIGYCIEGAHRMLVYENVQNGSLHECLHGSLGAFQPLTWKKRMNIIQGIAKGLAYLHEDIEPNIIHQAIKSSNILLDHQWNPRISDVGLSELLGPYYSNATTHTMVMSGYSAQEYASPDVLSAKSDVYSFGILVMEIVSGRIPVDRSQQRMYLVDWTKSMVGNHRIMDLLDHRLPEFPSVKELKRIILIALRCVDPDVNHRPKMGDVIHMLEPRDLLLNDAGSIQGDSSQRTFS